MHSTGSHGQSAEPVTSSPLRTPISALTVEGECACLASRFVIVQSLARVRQHTVPLGMNSHRRTPTCGQRVAVAARLATSNGRRKGIEMPRAPRVCNEPQCSVLIHDPKRRRCDLHYTPFGGNRETSRRTTTLAHRRRRLRVLGRAGYRCQIRYADICLGVATDFDHIIPLSEGGKDDDSNGQGACRACHARKSAIEARQAQL